MKKSFLLTIAIFVMSSLSLANEWRHISFKMNDNTITLAYQSSCYAYSGVQICKASPLWLNVSGNLRTSDKIRVVFINHPSPATYTSDEVQTIDLYPVYENGQVRFTGEIPYGLRTNIWQANQELAVVINGVWSTQYNGGRNYFFQMPYSMSY